MELGGQQGLHALQRPLTAGASDGEDEEPAPANTIPQGMLVPPPLLLAQPQQQPSPLSQPQPLPQQQPSPVQQPKSPRKLDSSLDRRSTAASSSSSSQRVLAEPFGMTNGGEPSSSSGGRRVQRSPAVISSSSSSSRRMMTPSRTSADARSALQRSLRADTVFATCVCHRIELEKLLESVAPSRTGGTDETRLRSPDRPSNGLSNARSGSAGTRSVTPTGTLGSSGSLAAAGSGSPDRGSSPPALGSAEPVRMEDFQMFEKYGTGTDLVVQLKFKDDKDLFVFRFGCMVFWSFTPNQLQAAKSGMRAFMDRELTSQDLEDERLEFVSEHMSDAGDVGEGLEGVPEESAGVSCIRQDQIILTTTNPLERLAHSYALAQSVRLSVFENTVDRSIASTRSIPETMAESGEVHLDANEVSRQMGGLLMLRCDVNLHTDILDTPEIFWDEERFEPHYITCRAYLDVDKRVDILNQRLGVLKDLYDLLQNGLNVKHGNKLEVIIIVLILLEVLLELIELLHDYFLRHK